MLPHGPDVCIEVRREKRVCCSLFFKLTPEPSSFPGGGLPLRLLVDAQGGDGAGPRDRPERCHERDLPCVSWGMICPFSQSRDCGHVPKSQSLYVHTTVTARKGGRISVVGVYIGYCNQFNFGCFMGEFGVVNSVRFARALRLCVCSPLWKIQNREGPDDEGGADAGAALLEDAPREGAEQGERRRDAALLCRGHPRLFFLLADRRLRYPRIH